MKVLSCIFFVFSVPFLVQADPYIVFEENGKVGLKNESGQVLIPPQYEALGWSDGSFSVIENVTGYNSGGLWGLINLQNSKVTNVRYEELYPGYGSLIIARRKSTLSLRFVMGCVNTSGKEVIPFQYDGIMLHPLRAVVYTKIGNQYKYGLIDHENKTLIPQQYQSIKAIGTLRFAVQNFNGKTALFSDAGKQITGFTIDSLSDFTKDYAILYEGLKRGVINREGQVKLEPKHCSIHLDGNGRVMVKNTNEWFFLSGDNRVLKETRADGILPVGRNLLSIEHGGLQTLCDNNLEPVSGKTFHEVQDFKKGKALIRYNGKWGVMRSSGTVVLEPRYESVFAGDDFFVVSIKSGTRPTWMLLDTLGALRMDRSYDNIVPFAGHLAVKNRAFWGMLNSHGAQLVSFAYDSLLDHKEGNLVVKFRGQYGAINLKEEWVIIPQSHPITLLSGSRYLEHAPSRTVLKSIDGNLIYFTDNPVEFNSGYLLERHSSGAVWKIDMNGLIVDRDVKLLSNPDAVLEPTEGLQAIQRNGKYGFVDSRGRLRIANRYEEVQPFSEGLAGVKILGKWGFVNAEDNIAIQPVYEAVTEFKSGVAYVKQKGLFGVIDTKGNLLLPIRYHAIRLLPSGNLLLQQDAQFGLADAQGKILISPRYDELQDPGSGYVIVKRNGKFGIVDVHGISTVPLIYDYIAYDPYHTCFLAMKKAEWREEKF